MGKKLKIELKVRVKVKNVDPFEYDLVMDVWRACMLFFERELRKMSDNGNLSKKTLYKIADGYDFTDLLRLNFETIRDDKRTRLVKLDEVSEAFQRVRNLPELLPHQQDIVNAVVEPPIDIPQTGTIPDQYRNESIRQNVEQTAKFQLPSNQPQSREQLQIQTYNTNPNLQNQSETQPRIIQDPSSNQATSDKRKLPSELQEPPDISVQEHLDILEKNTATAVVELRRMMYNNLQKLKERLED